MCNCKVILYNAQDDFPPELHQLDTGIAYCPLHNAAPELLSALQDLLLSAELTLNRASYTNCLALYADTFSKLEQARKAIANATGNTQSSDTR